MGDLLKVGLGVIIIAVIFMIAVKPFQTAEIGRHSVIERASVLGSPFGSRVVTVRSVSLPLIVKNENQVRAMADYSDILQERTDITVEQRDLIVHVASEKNVPAGLLFAIWTNESRRLDGGFAERRSWSSPNELLKSGSRCVRNYGAGRCQEWYRSVQVICAQRRADGSRVCETDDIRVSYSFDMGALQHNARSIVRLRSDGQYHFGPHIMDYDGDGVFDPHSLGESMMAAGALLRFGYVDAVRRGITNEQARWLHAASFYGGLHSGTSDRIREWRARHRRNIVRFWADWCAVDGYC